VDQVFKENDLELMRSLVYEPGLEPSFEFLKGCLIWSDERPEGLTPDAYDNLASLWIARSLLHNGLALSDDPINPEFTQKLWKRAINEVPEWPGFKRLALTEKDKQYLASVLESSHDF